MLPLIPSVVYSLPRIQILVHHMSARSVHNFESPDSNVGTVSEAHSLIRWCISLDSLGVFEFTHINICPKLQPHLRAAPFHETVRSGLP